MIRKVLLSVHLNGMVVGAEFLSFEELDRGLVELQDNYIVEQIKAIDVAVYAFNPLSQLSYVSNFLLSCRE